MVQEMHQPVPEELYNLTQLADVTLAAGKLSTTNLDTIKNYIRNEANETHLNDQNSFNSNKSYFTESIQKTIVKDLSENSSRSTSTTTNTYLHSLKFNRKNLDKKLHSIITSQIQKSTRNELKNISNTTTSTITIQQKIITNKQMSISSSDEDNNTTFNYCHKIFDKRKSRKAQHNLNDRRFFFENALRQTDDDSQLSSENDSNDYGEGCKNDGSGDDIHVCPECGKKYSTSSNLARHRQTHRSLMDKKARRCPHCDKVYVSMPAFSMHVRTHNQGCECPHCGKRFSRPWLLQGHIRTHTGEKPFQCSICAKAFADKSNLRAHVQTHSNTKPHSCARCGKAFALKSYLYKHEESSCMRNHLKTSDRDNHKIDKPSDQTCSSSSSKTSNIIIAKLPKKRRSSSSSSSTTTTMEPSTRKLKEKSINQLNDIGGYAKIQQESIIMDYGSQKSYIDLTNPISKGNLENFSRISVIRTALSGGGSNQLTENNYEQLPSFGFYQEKPMDFSPKNKFSNNCNGNFEITRNYAVIA